VISSSQSITTEALSQLAFVPTPNEFGLPYTFFSYRVSDDFAQSAPYTFTIMVEPVNDAPVATDDQISISKSFAAALDDSEILTATIPVLANDFDVDGDKLEIVATTAAIHGSTEISGGEIRYTSTGVYSGTDSFTYSVDDGHGMQATATVSVTMSVQRQPATLYLPNMSSR
jgi:hypothetical protein